MNSPDDNLIEQLGRLGAAAEGSVDKTTADAVARSPERLDAPLVELKRPHRSRMALAAAAALVLIAGFGAVLFGRAQEPEPASELATQEPDEIENDVPFTPVDDNGWEELRFCESSGQYDIDTGNTFYGAYQFTQAAWEAVGGTGNPADASPLEQDLRAAALYEAQGAEPWPVCNGSIDGPMANPLILDWASAWDQAHTLTVSIEARAPAEDIEAIHRRLREITRLPVVEVNSTEFAAELSDTLPTGPAVEPANSPSLAVVSLSTRSVSDEEVAELSALASVQGVFVQPTRPSLRIEIGSLGIDVLSPASWRLDDLRTGVGAVAPNGWRTAPDAATYATWTDRQRTWEFATANAVVPADGPLVLASAAWDLERLEPGDEIRVSASTDPNRGLSSVVTAIVAGPAQDRYVDQLTGRWLESLGSVVLVAPHPTELDQRIVVRTESPLQRVQTPND